MTIWFCSDTHWGHRNILKFTNRPFETIEDMNEQLIANWNACVQPNDSIYHLGDFAYRQSTGSLLPIFERLNGTKHLIIGNHDNEEVFRLPWASQDYYREIKIDGQHIVLFHYAIVQWNRSRHKSIHLHGHHHGTLHHGKLEHAPRRIDIGVDCFDLHPVSWDHLKARISNELSEHDSER
jgi:calcineurin-like phosphoesterase family protein